MPRPEESDSDARRDSRLREFLRRAAPIVAAERGWNEKSRLKLKSLADDLHLPSDLYSQGVEQLKSSSGEWMERLTKYERAFTERVRSHLAWEKSKVLSSVMQDGMVREGVSKYQLAPALARDLLHRITDELGMSRVSYSDAERHVQELIDDAVGSSTFVAPETIQRLSQAAQQWGVERHRVETLIQATLQSNQLLARPESSWIVRSLAVVAGIAVLGALILLAWRMANPPREPAGDRQSDLPSSGPREIPTPEMPQWMSPESEASLGALPELSPEIRGGLAATDTLTRRHAYRQLAEQALRTDLPEERRLQIRLLGRMLRDDPEFHDEPESLSLDVLQSISAEISLPSSLPEDASRFRRGLRANEILKGVYDEFEDRTKKEIISQLAASRTGFVISDDPDSYLTVSQAQIARAQWRQLQAACNVSPQHAAGLIEPLRQLTEAYLQPEIQYRVFSATVTLIREDATLLPMVSRHLDDVISKANLQQCYELFEVMQSTADENLQQFLRTRLASRLNIDTSADRQVDLLDEIKRSLRVSARRSSRLQAQWERLNLVSGLARLEQIDLDAVPDPRAIARAAYYATAACLLRQAEQRSDQPLQDQFSEMLQKEPPQLSLRSPGNEIGSNLPEFGRIDRRAFQSTIRTRDTALDRLAKFRELDATARALAFERLCSVARRFPDVTSAEALTIADYLLTADQTPDVLAQESYASRLSHWANVALALADRVEESDCSLDHAVTVVQLVTGLRFEPNAGQWRSALKQAILRHTADGLQWAAERSGVDTQFQWDELRGFLQAQYRIRCATAGVRGSAISGARSPVELLNLLILQVAEETGLEPIEQKQLARRIESASSMARSEVEHFVLAQQTLAEVLIENRAPPVERPVDWQMKLSSAFQQCRSIKTQMLFGEHLLQLCWSEDWEAL